MRVTSRAGRAILSGCLVVAAGGVAMGHTPEAALPSNITVEIEIVVEVE